MSTYTQIIYQIVFSTKNRETILSKDNRSKLFEYIVGIFRNNKCHLYRINAVEDHVHIISHLHPTIALASLVKDIKIASSAFIKDKALFKHFVGWQDGYGAFTYSFRDKDKLIEYVKNQEEHHKKFTFREEYITLLNEHGIEFDEKYLL
jgi:REP element-mobilizing transposase RayT